jgi:hypothetical protein
MQKTKSSGTCDRLCDLWVRNAGQFSKTFHFLINSNEENNQLRKKLDFPFPSGLKVTLLFCVGCFRTFTLTGLLLVTLASSRGRQPACWHFATRAASRAFHLMIFEGFPGFKDFE